MTIEETRKLGIEFERRVQTMIPDTQFGEKLDTETIYSFLNQYQDKYVHDIYRNLDAILSGTNLKSHIDSVLQSLLKTVTVEITEENKRSGVVSSHMGTVNDSNDVPIVDTARSIRYAVPNDYYLYVRSVSLVSGTYSFRANGGSNTSGNLPIRVVPNQLVSQNDVWKLVETPHDSLRILRYPAAVMTEPVVVTNFAKKYRVTEVITDHESLDHYIEDDLLCWLTPAPGSHSFTDEISVGDYIDLQTLSNESGIPVDTLLSGIDKGHTDIGIGLPADFFSIEKVVAFELVEEEQHAMLPTITVIYDQYTTPNGIKVTYYKEPSHFSLMTSTPCELPMDSFEELVSGAVDLYVQYVAGAEARKRQLDEARRLAAKEQEANNARRGRNSE